MKIRNLCLLLGGYIRKAFLNVAIIVTVTLLLLVVLETSAFLYYKVFPTETLLHDGWLRDRENKQAYSYFEWKEKFFKQRKWNGCVYEPYSLWKAADAKSDLFNVVDGYRKTINVKKENVAKHFTIYFFGASTMFCVDVPDEYTVPSIFAKKISPLYSEINFDVFNYALPAFVSENELHLLVTLLKNGQIPNLVIFYDGVADIGVKAMREEPHDHYIQFVEASKGLSRTILDRIVRKSYFIALFKPNEIHGMVYIQDQNILHKNTVSVVKDYLNNIRFINNLASVYGFKAIFLWSPSIFTTHKRLTEEEKTIVKLSNNRMAGHRIASDYMNAAIFPKKYFENFYNLENALDSIDKSVFFDAMHISAIGNEKIADTILEIVTKDNYIRNEVQATPVGWDSK